MEGERPRIRLCAGDGTLSALSLLDAQNGGSLLDQGKSLREGGEMALI